MAQQCNLSVVDAICRALVKVRISQSAVAVTGSDSRRGQGRTNM